MELSLRYVFAIWEHQSFSKAAQALYVSQSALSATVAKLENNLGFKIFDRSTHPISLTVKGKLYINYLKEINEAENLLIQQLKSTDNIENGSLTIGGNVSSVYSILPSVCGIFLKKYPNIHVTINMDATAEKLKNQTLDLLLSFAPQNEDFITAPLLEERLMIAIHKSHPCASRIAYYAVPPKEMMERRISPEHEIEDLSVLSDVPFIKTGKPSDSDRRLSIMIKDHKVALCCVAHAKSFDMRYRMMQEGLGAILASDLFLSKFPQDQENIYYFALKNPLSYRKLLMHRRKNSDNDKILEAFAETLIEYCQSKEPLLHNDLLLHF